MTLMPDSMPAHDVLMGSIGRLQVIRALLASRSWPSLADLSQAERDVALNEMAQSEYRAESKTHGQP
ncbi:MAG: hypothetical protein M3Z05_10165 [Gemmatimonadota bacterium]|nr:hypothetical protein [Gemmatimonadota bacterium]